MKKLITFILVAFALSATAGTGEPRKKNNRVLSDECLKKEVTLFKKDYAISCSWTTEMLPTCECKCYEVVPTPVGQTGLWGIWVNGSNCSTIYHICSFLNPPTPSAKVAIKDYQIITPKE